MTPHTNAALDFHQGVVAHMLNNALVARKPVTFKAFQELWSIRFQLVGIALDYRKALFKGLDLLPHCPLFLAQLALPRRDHIIQSLHLLHEAEFLVFEGADLAARSGDFPLQRSIIIIALDRHLLFAKSNSFLVEHFDIALKLFDLKGVAVDILPGLPQGGFVDRQALFNLRFSLRYVPDFSSKLENFSVVFL